MADVPSMAVCRHACCDLVAGSVSIRFPRSRLRAPDSEAVRQTCDLDLGFELLWCLTESHQQEGVLVHICFLW